MTEAAVFTVEQRGDEFVLSGTGDEIVGRFASREGALARARELREDFQTKTEDGVSFPPAAYAFVPDRETPSTWKLRLWESPSLKETARQVGMAIAAIGKGFRGQKVQIPTGDKPAVLRRIRAAWNKVHADASPEDMPPILKGTTFAQDDPPRDKLFALKGVEIFRTGKWKGELYTNKDLDDMVAAFGLGPGKSGFRPPVKLGHFNKSGDPAFGWIEGITRMGSKLIADLMDLPKEVFTAIRDRRFDAVSAEIAFNMEVGEKVFRRVLLGIALLGSDIPAVAGLKPLRDVANDLGDLSDLALGGVHIYNLRSPKEGPMDNAEILAKHRDRMKKLEDDLALAKKDGDDDAAAKIELELATARAELAEAERDEAKAKLEQSEKDKDAAVKKAGEGEGETAVKLASMQAEIDESKAKIATADARARDAEIERKLDGLNIPALRPTLRAMLITAYDLRDAGKKVNFTWDEGEGDERKTHQGDVDPVKIIDAHLDRLQKGTKKLFAELGFAGDFGPEQDEEKHDDAGKEVARLVTKHQTENQDATYQDALHAVLAADADLKKRYHAS